MLTVHLVKTHCLPSLLYSCEIRNLNTSDARSVDVAWNNAFRKIFKGFWRESVKTSPISLSVLTSNRADCSA